MPKPLRIGNTYLRGLYCAGTLGGHSLGKNSRGLTFTPSCRSLATLIVDAKDDRVLVS
jgi:hypothetical protein